VTALQLLSIILAALLMQLALGIAVVVRRRHVASRVALSQPSTPAASASSRDAWPGWREFRVVRRSFEDAAHSQYSFHLQPMDGLPLPAFLPGQFLTFSLPADGSGSSPEAKVASATAPSITRCDSLSDRPDPTGYRITIKRVPAPKGRPEWPAGLSSTYFHDRVREGTVLKVRTLAGHFVIDADADASVPVVLLAGGIGVTPLMSMLRWCVAEQPERTLHLYYGVRNGGDHASRQSLAQLAAEHLAFHLHVVYSQPGADDHAGLDYQHAGRVNVELLRRTLPHGRHQFYVCGPPAMMQSLVPALVQWGVPPPDVHFEAFGPASVQLPGAVPAAVVAALAEPIDVEFSRSGRTLSWDGQDKTLLDFTDRHGLAIDSGCRSGSCGSCET
jgi:ferredoxin-NADP reductase